MIAMFLGSGVWGAANPTIGGGLDYNKGGASEGHLTLCRGDEKQQA